MKIGWFVKCFHKICKTSRVNLSLLSTFRLHVIELTSNFKKGEYFNLDLRIYLDNESVHSKPHLIAFIKH